MKLWLKMMIMMRMMCGDLTLSCPILHYRTLPYLTIAVVPGFLLTDDSSVEDGNKLYLLCYETASLVFFWRFDPIPGDGLRLPGLRDHTPHSLLDEWSVRHRDLYLTKHNTHKRKTSVSLAGFEPAISASERPQTYPLDRAANRIGTWLVSDINL